MRADREQVERLREVDDPADFYAPVAERFRLDPRRTDDATLEVLRSLADSEETWLDIGAGGGRFALPIALLVREVICVEPSSGMVAVLRGGMRDSGIDNVRIVESRWPMATEAPTADVSLMAHVGYDIEDIGAFLDAAESSTRRVCVAVMGEAAMTTVATLFWQPVHDEPRIRLPALPELLTLLLAMGRLPEVRLVDRLAPSFESLEALFAMARRQLWVRPESQKDRMLERLVRERAVQRDRRWSLGDQPARIGIVTWSPV